MVRTKKLKSSGRFGARYGRSVKLKITEVESRQKNKTTMYLCNGVAKRLSKGIWQCNKAGKTFAEHTYFLPVKEQ
jgi:large subunit ribosomal protein L37Ae